MSDELILTTTTDTAEDAQAAVGDNGEARVTSDHQGAAEEQKTSGDRGRKPNAGFQKRIDGLTRNVHQERQAREEAEAKAAELEAKLQAYQQTTREPVE